MKRAMVLSSGGIDSTTCMALAIKHFGASCVHSVSFFYGQKHNKELEAAKAIAEHYGVPHTVLNLSEIFKDSNCSLLAHSTEKIRHESYAEQIAKDGEGMVRTYVPFRNGLMLASAASLAGSLYPEDEVDLFIGAHADDAAGQAYADCSEEFMLSMHRAIRIGSYGKIGVTRPLVEMNKAKVVFHGINHLAPYELTWSCYEGGEKPCGTCGTCIDRAAAFAFNEAVDPALRR